MAVAFSNYSLEIENAMQLFYHTLSEKERRRYVAVEAVKLGYGGQSYIASVVGCNRDTVASGIAELATLPDEANENRIRRPGGGRKKATVSEPDLVDNFFLSSSLALPVTRCRRIRTGPICHKPKSRND